jgi:hypothetical protein
MIEGRSYARQICFVFEFCVGNGKYSFGRIQRRVQQTILEEAKQQLQDHLGKTKEQQDRLRQLITKGGGIPTQEKGKLPIAIPPESITKIIDKVQGPCRGRINAISRRHDSRKC